MTDKLLQLAQDLYDLLYHYEDDPQWKALRKKAKAAIREAERRYSIETTLQVAKGGGQVQLVNEFSCALATSGVRIQPGTYDLVITRRPKVTEPKPKPLADPPDPLLTCHKETCRKQCTKDAADDARKAKLEQLRKTKREATKGEQKHGGGFVAVDWHAAIDAEIAELEGGALVCPSCDETGVWL